MAPAIGTLRETHLHASLKHWYARSGDRVECPVDGFVIDLVREDLLIEIQTSGFSSMKRKVTSLIDQGHRVRIVHPIPADKWIVKVDDDGVVLSRRRSPKHGTFTDVFAELVSFPEALGDELEVEVIVTIEEELRRHVPGRAWRRKGWVVAERRLLEIVDSQLIKDVADLRSLLPPGLPDTFTTADLAERLGRPRRVAQQMAYCLRKTGVLTEVGRSGNAIEYQLAD